MQPHHHCVPALSHLTPPPGHLWLQYKTYKIVYRRYAGLYFLFCVDVTDNELLYLETIHLFVEVGHCFLGVGGRSALRRDDTPACGSGGCCPRGAGCEPLCMDHSALLSFAFLQS